MRFMRTVIAVAALLAMASPALAQTAPTSAGTLDPAANRPAQPRAVAEPQFVLADGIVATVNDRIITGFDLRQRMLLIIIITSTHTHTQSHR